jgi:hypothetical protein
VSSIPNPHPTHDPAREGTDSVLPPLPDVGAAVNVLLDRVKAMTDDDRYYFLCYVAGFAPDQLARLIARYGEVAEVRTNSSHPTVINDLRSGGQDLPPAETSDRSEVSESDPYRRICRTCRGEAEYSRINQKWWHVAPPEDPTHQVAVVFLDRDGDDR